MWALVELGGVCGAIINLHFVLRYVLPLVPKYPAAVAILPQLAAFESMPLLGSKRMLVGQCLASRLGNFEAAPTLDVH